MDKIRIVEEDDHQLAFDWKNEKHFLIAVESSNRENIDLFVRKVKKDNNRLLTKIERNK